MSLFSALSLAEAEKKAAAESRWVLIDFTADWCGPCQAMEKTTWRAPEVFEWVAQKAIAVQVDVDAEPTIAERFAVRAMPTMLVLRKGEELDRAVGARSASQLVAWLRGLEEGLTHVEQMRAGPADPQARLQLAEDLVRAEKYEEAAAEAMHLYEQTQSLVPLVELLKDLVFLVPSLKERLETLREHAEKSGLPDLLLLNEVLGMSARPRGVSRQRD